MIKDEEESAEGRDSFMVISTERLNKITNFIKKNRICLLRSPPSSGKSTLGMALQEYFSNEGESLYVSLCGMHGREEIHSNEDRFNEFWKNETGGFSWTDIKSCTEDTFVFIDEIQLIYGERSPFFWGDVKQLMSSNKQNKHLWLFFLGAYHPKLGDQLTPVQFIHTLGINWLYLTNGEYQRLAGVFIQTYNLKGSPLFEIPEDVRNSVFNITGGHPGLCRHILKQLLIHYHNGSTEVVSCISRTTK